MVKTIVGSFDTYQTAYKAAHELIDAGFLQSDISVIASNIAGDYTRDGRARTVDSVREAETDAVAGGIVGGSMALTASLLGLAIPGLGPVIAAGPLVALLAGTGAGAMAGGLVGALTHSGVGEDHAAYYAESVRRGGAIVTVRVDASRAERAEEIIRDNGAMDIDERAIRWRDSGWTGWDASSPPYTVEEAERERRMYGTHADPLSGLPLTGDAQGDNRRDSTIRR